MGRCAAVFLDRPGINWRARLREAIDRADLKYSVIARRSGISPTTLSRILNAREHPRFETVVNLAHTLDETVGWLVGEDAYRLTHADREKLIEAAALILRFASRTEDEAELMRMVKGLPE